MTAFYDERLETLPSEGLRGHQWARVERLAREVYPSNPFIARKWREAGIRAAEDLRSWEDWARLPFTRKPELVEDQAARPPFGSNLTYPLERYVRVHQTSGTTGAPLRWLDTQAAWDWWLRCWGFVLRGAALGPGDRIFFPFSFGLFVGFWAGFEGARALGAMAIPGGGQDSAQRLAAIEALGATAVCCTPSYALHLAQVARERGVDLRRLGVRTAVYAGEPGAGIPAVRARLEEEWGARAHDHAGMTEMGAHGFECEAQAGLHINESEFIAEIIDPATGAPAREGELVLSNLGRPCSPLLRYRTGDRVRAATSPCGCGRTFLRLEGGILGRVDDMLVIRGVNVFPSALEGIIRRFPAVVEFMIEVYRRDEMDEVRLLLEIAESQPRQVAAAVQEALRVDLGIRIETVPAPPQSLPRYELKARRLVRRAGGQVLHSDMVPGPPRSEGTATASAP
ncbi:MAG: phenylacetate--CoA ligase family protein [Candidatus Rokubacteria bacterium]|nr:phenylacetate--CoA ligase family protein [Candidatus Rokubacteria bacterium]